jgi:hypothetical protein
MESSCEFGIEPSGSMKCWETIKWPSISGLSNSVQLHIVKFVSIVKGRRGPWGCETSTLPQFPENRFTDGGEVVSLTP